MDVACGCFLPVDAGLTEDFVSDKCCPATASEGCAGMLVVVFCTPILIGNLLDAVGVGVSARVQSGIAVDEACGCGILRLQLVQNLGDVGFRDRLAVGQSSGSRSAGSLGFLRLYGSRVSGLSRVANLAELAVDRYAGADNFTGAGVYGSLRVGIGDITAGVSGVLHHAVDYDSGLSAVHDTIAIERTVGVTSNNAKGIHVGDRITVLAGDAIIVCDFGNSLVLVVGAGREALLGHDVGHELGHVIPGDATVHLLAVLEDGLEAGVSKNTVYKQSHAVRNKGSILEIGFRVVLGNGIGVECSGEHDDEVIAGDCVGRLERAVCIAADDALVRAPDNRIMERVRAGYVAETQDRRESVRNCVELGILRDAGIANRTVGVDVRVILDGEGRDGQGQCHNNRESCRNKTADVVMGAHIRLFHVCVLSQISFSHGKVSGRIRGTVSRPPSCFAGGRIWGYAGNLP